MKGRKPTSTQMGPELYLRKLARTIADLKGDAAMGGSHVSEAVTYRSLDRRPPSL
jgi:hypothetical protein